MRFSDPIYLLVLLPALGWLFVVARGMHGMARGRKRLALAVRGALLLLLACALAGLQSARPNRGVTTVFALDRSASMRDAATERAEAFIRKSLSAMGPDDKAGLVVFGKDPVVDVTPGGMRTLGRIYGAPDASATDMAAAIRLASATFPGGTARRIVILSDGNETDGDAAQAAAVAATDGIQIDYLPPDPAPSATQVAVSDVSIPAHITRGEPFEVKVSADATAPTDGVIRLDRDGAPIARLPVRLNKGSNTLAISQTVNAPGFYRYRAVLEAQGDADPRNNTGIGYVSVVGRPRVLLLEGRSGIGEPLERALTGHGMEVTRAGVEGLPAQADDLQGYDAVLLDDFGAERISDGQMRLIASTVRESGVGFGMIGGEDSFLPGGYYETPIADVLAVDLNVRQRKTFPSTTIVIVIDSSGSMDMVEDGVRKIKIAASAASATVRMMSPNDYVGVAGSTDMIQFVAPVQRAVDKDHIVQQVGRLDVGGGGIYVQPSLEFGYKALKESDSKVRHMILLADGADCDSQEGAVELAARMAAEKMTVSVVSIGAGKDVNFLKSLAAAGKGQFYLALRAKQIQRLFTRDAAVMSRSAIEEGTFLPKVDPGDEVLRGLNLRTMPALHAYDLASDRPLSRVPMRTAKDDPLLAFWQYGLGTSMAFTSDAQPKWARPWFGWTDFSGFWAQTVRGTLRRASNNRIQVSTHREGGRGIVSVEAYDASGAPINGLPAKVNVLMPDGAAREASLQQEGPGRYAGSFEASQTGGYIVSVAESAPGGTPRVTRSGFSIAYPPEYQAARPNAPLLARLAGAAGGEALDAPMRAFRRSANPGTSVRDLWPALLLAAAILFPFDVAVRRLALPFAAIWAAALAFASRLMPRRALAPARQTEAIGQLQAARRRAAPSAPEAPVVVRGEEPVSPKARPSEAPDSAQPLSAAQRLLDAKRKRGG
ncbi:MAG TPA: VWA domain-containing protein [Armatimonadota bacterium]|jgi:uncharacterized membrane protein